MGAQLKSIIGAAKLLLAALSAALVLCMSLPLVARAAVSNEVDSSQTSSLSLSR